MEVLLEPELTWVPDPNNPNDGPPPQVFVVEGAAATASTAWFDYDDDWLPDDWDQHNERLTMSADNGIGTAQTNPYASCATSSGARLTVLPGAPTVDLTDVDINVSGTIDPGTVGADFDYYGLECAVYYQVTCVTPTFLERRHVVTPPGTPPDTSGLGGAYNEIATGGGSSPEQLADVAVDLGPAGAYLDASSIAPKFFPRPTDGDSGSFTALAGPCVTDSNGIAVIGTAAGGNKICGVDVSEYGAFQPWLPDSLQQVCNIGLLPAPMSSSMMSQSQGLVTCEEFMNDGTPVQNHTIKFTVIAAEVLVQDPYGQWDIVYADTTSGNYVSFSPATVTTDSNGMAESELSVTQTNQAVVLDVYYQAEDQNTLEIVTGETGP